MEVELVNDGPVTFWLARRDSRHGLDILEMTSSFMFDRRQNPSRMMLTVRFM